MATAQDSTPARPLSVGRICGLMELARASHVGVDDEAGDKLIAIESRLWDLMASRPVKSSIDARLKLEAVLDDLERFRQIDARSAQIIRQVIAWLDDQ